MSIKLNEQERRKAAKAFAEYWKDEGYEKGESQKFWLELLGTVYGVENASHYIEFEDQVHLDHTSFIDGYIPETKVLIEQKGLGKDLRKAIKQSDGSLLTPFQQAKRYSAELPFSRRPRWIITCNFSEFLVYDMENPNSEPEQILLKNLDKEFYRLDFLVDTGNENIKKELEISKNAGEIIGKIYGSFIDSIGDKLTDEMTRALNIFCVRLVFCYFAEDAGLFNKNLFRQYLESFNKNNWRSAFKELFEILDQPKKERDPFLDGILNDFPYVNGSLFSENTAIPPITEDVADEILIGCEFNWKEISPTIFGAVFESTLNPETRRAGGMHYTSIENIHKVIDPLFLNEFKNEYHSALEISELNIRNRKLRELQNKLASKKFFDPACGSGNFLTETYISLRRLENRILKHLKGDQIEFDLNASKDDVKVSIQQFYGIEINDFAVSVAKTALWIAEIQMLEETNDIFHSVKNPLPLNTYNNIVEGNALRIDWETVVPKNELDFIMGNPPFVGKKEQNKEQKQDLKSLFEDNISKFGILDYVSGWFYLASELITKNPNIRASFVSTDSICQGEQVPVLWKYLIEHNEIKINFAYRTFKWNNETKNTAEVYCIIVGFSSKSYNSDVYLFSNIGKKKVDFLNPYLVNAPNIWLDSISSQITGHSKIQYGSMPIDNGFLIVNEDEYEELYNRDSVAINYIKKYSGAEELLKGKKRYCIWLKDVSRKDILKSKFITNRIEQCKKFRETSKRKATNKLADTPELFGEIRQPEGSMIVIPKVSSKHRRYIPIMIVNGDDCIINGSSLIIPNGNLFEFGILSSNVHNSWIRTIAETWGHSYQYSTDIYNNFPFPKTTKEQNDYIEKTAKNILDIREKYADLTIAEMYNPKLGIVKDLLDAHRENDKAVMQAYGFDYKTMTESECVAELMKMYQKLVGD